MSERRQVLLVSLQGSRALVRDQAGVDTQVHLRRSAGDLAVGDQVVIEETGEQTAVLVERLPRQTELFRTDMRGRKKLIAANLDTLAIVVAPEPEPHLGLVDRYLAAAELSGIEAAILINKTDLGTHACLDQARRIYPSLGYSLLEISAYSGESLAGLQQWVEQRKLAFLGQSGVGKSSLINLLAGEDVALVGSLSHKRAKGRHTTTASFIHPVKVGGWIMDSPGIREFDNSIWTPEEVLWGFPEIYAASRNCQFRNCNHGADRGCAVRAALEAGEIERSRFRSYLAIITDAPSGAGRGSERTV